MPRTRVTEYQGWGAITWYDARQVICGEALTSCCHVDLRGRRVWRIICHIPTHLNFYGAAYPNVSIKSMINGNRMIRWYLILHALKKSGWDYYPRLRHTKLQHPNNVIIFAVILLCRILMHICWAKSSTGCFRLPRIVELFQNLWNSYPLSTPLSLFGELFHIFGTLFYKLWNRSTRVCCLWIWLQSTSCLKELTFPKPLKSGLDLPRTVRFPRIVFGAEIRSANIQLSMGVKT